jgi:hypothetical protein
MRKIFPVCCASAKEAVVSKTVASSHKRDFVFIASLLPFADHRQLLFD